MAVDKLEGIDLDYAVELIVFQRDSPPTTGWYKSGTAPPTTGWYKNGDHWQLDVPDILEDGSYARSWTVHTWPPAYHDSDFLAFQIVDYLFPIGATEFYLSNQGPGWEALFVAPDKYMGRAVGKRTVAICWAAIEYVVNNPGLLDEKKD